ncbi:hypothetical protein [Mycolicibacterium sp. P1-5]|uniref:hypothetical protein n=1 Tax=Mycolicibacterium sp. P1-5 TaxID=2024617 RepID=UPI0011EBDE86|nr:hypothetical protein [Mycolicibacterium sp. P1-5]KAA0110212.1 hypothetical protein CIW47_08440 [Mycolicibacterium sp. P1-5]
MTGPSISGQVALVKDDYTLVINRGTEAGVTEGMVFAVHSRETSVITDPESGRELGRLSHEKLRVRVVDAQPLFARAHTFVETDSFYGLLQIPFTASSVEDIVTVDVGDAVELVSGQACTYRTGTDR